MLHIRNLPYETTEEELRELCSAFGPIVQTKLNVGANKNQAFVEFPELNMAINMVSYYANSADPAKVSKDTALTAVTDTHWLPLWGVYSPDSIGLKLRRNTSIVQANV